MQPSKTNEQALEIAIERALTGTCTEDLGAVPQMAAQVLGGNGFYVGFASDFNAQYAIDERRFWHFLESTQAKELAKMQRYADWKARILSYLDKMIGKYGILRLLRKGMEIDDAHFTLLYPMPLASSSASVQENFERNEFSVTRQVRYNTLNQRESIDMVLFINGLPVATIELKNAWTGQTASLQGINQYKYNRDETQPLLRFARCLVHFAVDTDEAYMCTKLAGKNSFFLPFNKGNNNGKGNPPNVFGHKTAYLWEEIFTRRSLAAIIQHFVLLDGKSTEALANRTLIFPRYHQLDVVRRLLHHAATQGVGHTYLIQHSAGSGKSNSITWAAYQLIEVYAANAAVSGGRGVERPLFDSVVVVTDRRLLDKQLRENIKEFAEVKNIVAPAYSSKDLQEALEQGKKIIITTIQKFPFIVDGIADLSEKRFAVIIDEAHSSQSGTAAGKMNQAMGIGEQEAEEEEADAQEFILRAMRARKMKGNASYLAFTATPKNTTLERFGVQQADGSFKPFHLYSMKQAIEEGFILDVLANYTTYKSYYEIEKSIQENPLFDSKKAQKKLRAYVERHRQTIETKAEIIVEQFMAGVYNDKKLKGKGKAMVITQNIEAAIRYYWAIKRIVSEKGALFKVAVAFSGKKMVDGIECTEELLNGFAEGETSAQFDRDEYRILVVANKYLTGFDQPKLCAMFVDKKLQGVLAVQALSRLNRAAPKWGKKTEDLFILDFFNEIGDIKSAFDPFYTSTTLSGATDVNVLHELKGVLDAVGVYEWSEVDIFVEKYLNGAQAGDLSPLIDVAAQRFNAELELSHEEKADFKIKAKQFVKIYGQMAAIMPYEVENWEKLFWFLKFLIPKLLVKSQEEALVDELLESVDLSTYGLERTKLKQSIRLDDSDSELDPQNANPRSAHESQADKNPLDEIIASFNERFFSGWEDTPEASRVKVLSFYRNVAKHKDFEAKVKNNPDKQNSDLALTKILNEVFAEKRKAEIEDYKRWVSDEGYKTSFIELMKRLIVTSDEYRVL